jgi:hypothetical protein
VIVRSARLTLRIHRAEVLAAVALVLSVVLAIIIVTARLISVGPSECLLRSNDPSCQTVLDAFYRIRYDEASWLLGVGAGLFPVVIGLILGVPIVGRELEMRTAHLAWSLSASRVRWLLQRLLPMFGVLLACLSVVAMLEVLLLWTSSPGTFIPRMDQLGSQGPTFVGRGIMAFGLATLAGALLGRTLPAFLLSAMVAISLALAGSTALAAGLAHEWAIWREEDAEQHVPELLSLRELYRTDGGQMITWSEVLAWYEGQPAGTEWEQWEATHVTRMELIVPLERFGDFERAETLAAVAVGLAGLLATFSVVTQRRPD